MDSNALEMPTLDEDSRVVNTGDDGVDTSHNLTQQ